MALTVKSIFINVLQDKPTIFKIPVVHRTTIDRNLIGLLKGRLDYYESIRITKKYFCPIIIPLLLRYIIFDLIYIKSITGYIYEYKTLYHISLIFF